jgi:hypothetical protein
MWKIVYQFSRTFPKAQLGREFSVAQHYEETGNPLDIFRPTAVRDYRLLHPVWGDAW